MGSTIFKICFLLCSCLNTNHWIVDKHEICDRWHNCENIWYFSLLDLSLLGLYVLGVLTVSNLAKLLILTNEKSYNEISKGTSDMPLPCWSFKSHCFILISLPSFPQDQHASHKGYLFRLASEMKRTLNRVMAHPWWG